MGQYQQRAAAIILGVILIFIGLVVGAILDSQAAFSGDTTVSCTAAKANEPTFKFISKSAADCVATGGLVVGDFRAPTPTSGQLTELNKSGATASSTTIASFSGAKPMNDLLPLLFRVVLVMVGVGMIGIGGAGMLGYGRLAGR